MVVLTHRPLDPALRHHGTLDRFGSTSSARVIELEPLSEAGLAAVVQQRLGLRPTSALLRRLAEHTDGSPLLVTMLLSHWSANGSLLTRQGIVDVRPQARPVAPADIERSLLERLDLLEPLADELVAVLAVSSFLEVLPSATVTALLAGIVDQPMTSIADAIDAACDADVLYPTANGFRFAHSRLRDVVIERLGPRRGAELHRRIGTALLADDPQGGPVSLGEAYPALVLHHLLAGAASHEPNSRAVSPRVDPAGAPESVNSPDDAIIAEWAISATERCLATGAWRDAAHYAQTALDHGARWLPDGSSLALVGGIAHFRDHDQAAAQLMLRRAADDAIEAGDLVTEGRALLLLHRNAMAITDAAQGRVESARSRDALIAFIRRDEPSVPALTARAAAQLAEEAVTRHDIDDAQQWITRAREVADGAELDALLAEVDFAEGLVAMGRLDLSLAERRFAECRDRALAESDPWVASWGAGRLALLRLMTGNAVRARIAIEDALDMQLPLRLWSELALTRAAAASLAASVGDFDRAVAMAEESERLAIRSGYPFARLTAVPVLAYVAIQRGDPDAARNALPRLVEPYGRVPWPYVALVEASTGLIEDALEQCAARAHRLSEPPTLDRLAAVVATAIVASRAADERLWDAVTVPLEDLRSRGVALLPGWPIALASLAAPSGSSSVLEQREPT
jgi:hypothetical protein